jgi:predicted nucleic acid-binding protein
VDRLIVLDTSVLIDVLRGDREARRALSAATEAGEQFAASMVTKVEILQGMRSSERTAVRRVLAVLHLVALDDDVADLAGEFGRRYRASHRGIDVPDFVIAATAAHLDAPLWTRNVKHFPMFEGLTTPY